MEEDKMVSCPHCKGEPVSCAVAESCCGSEDGVKHKQRSEEEYKKLINRLCRIEGQIRGIRTMVEENRYCTDILTQSAAAAAALEGFNRELLDSHIRTCVAENLRAGNDEVVDELLHTLHKLI